MAEVSSEDELSLLHLEDQVAKPLTVNVKINGTNVPMEVDTGAAMSVMTVSQQKELIPTATLQPSSVVLKTYTKVHLQICGEMIVQVKHQDKCLTLPLLIVKGKGPALLG